MRLIVAGALYVICAGALRELIDWSVSRSEPVPELAELVSVHWIFLPVGTVTPPGATIVPPLAITIPPVTPEKLTVLGVWSVGAGVPAGPMLTLPPLRVLIAICPWVETWAILRRPLLTTVRGAPAAERFADRVPRELPALPSVTPPRVVATSNDDVVAAWVWVMAPPARSVKAPAAIVDRLTAFLSVYEAGWVPEVICSEPTSLPALVSVTAPATVATAIPEAVIGAVWVTAPTVARVNCPAVTPAIAMSFLSTIVTFRVPLLTFSEVKSLPLLARVIAPAVFVIVVGPVTTIGPVCVISPAVLSVRSPAFMPPMMTPFLSVKLTTRGPLSIVSVPTSLLALKRIMLPKFFVVDVAVRLVATIAPVWVR